MSYTKTTWVDGEAPPISAENLNKMEAGIEAAHNKVSGAWGCLPLQLERAPQGAGGFYPHIGATIPGDGADLVVFDINLSMFDQSSPDLHFAINNFVGAAMEDNPTWYSVTANSKAQVYGVAEENLSHDGLLIPNTVDGGFLMQFVGQTMLGRYNNGFYGFTHGTGYVLDGSTMKQFALKTTYADKGGFAITPTDAITAFKLVPSGFRKVYYDQLTISNAHYVPKGVHT
jgi:hypothetical protein